MRPAFAFLGSFAIGCVLTAACAASGDDDDNDDPSGTGGCATCGTGAAGGSTSSGGSAGTGEGGEGQGGEGGLFEPPDGGTQSGDVYGHSDKTLFKLEPISKAVTIVGNFDCVQILLPGSGEGMWDIALDKDGNMVGTSASMQNFTLSGALVTIDKATAHCTPIATGIYPNSLTYVPAGSLDPNVEALVGFKEAEYVRIDPSNGAQTVVGNLNPNATGQSWESSGDVVSIIGGKTYLTVKPLGSGSSFGGTDHIVEIDATTGAATKLIGDTTYPKLWGLGYWDGTAYGFSATGQLCAIDLGDGTATGIPVTDPPPGLQFWGAGVTTAAPVGIPN
jgi:hypothetical protein